jgi:hypothetical protein
MNKKEEEEVNAQNLLQQINQVISELEDEGEEVLADTLHQVFIKVASYTQNDGEKDGSE